jgi:murein DD-endopeptidase MepM/ murein hydrolase activator NlpD
MKSKFLWALLGFIFTASISSGYYICSVSGKTLPRDITSPFGPRIYNNYECHPGIDIASLRTTSTAPGLEVVIAKHGNSILRKLPSVY